MTTRILPALSGDPVRVGPYRIVGRLGSGGMGTVHAALDASGRRLAVKVVHAAQAGDGEFRARFRREVALTSRVSGPFLVPVLAADCDAERPWLATSYVQGPTLQQYITTHGALEGALLHALAAGTAAALSSIHEAGVIHRDIKPANVILSPDGPRLLDFGIAHALDGTSVTHTGVLTGTPGWISPEQYRTGAATVESDVFAWGALVAYAGTGRHPFGTGAPDTIAFRVMSQEPDLADLPEDLRRLAASALSKNPADRPSARVLGERCVGLLEHQDTHVLPQQHGAPTLVDGLVAGCWDLPSAQADVWPPARHEGHVRRYALIAAAAVGVLVIAAAVVYATTLRKQQEPSAAAPHSTASASSSPAPLSASPSPPSANPATLAASTPTATEAPAKPQPAYTRSDNTQPTVEEWAAAHDAMTASEQNIATAINEDVGAFLRDEWALPDGVQVTFNPKAQTMFLTTGPSVTVSENGGDYTELRRSVMFAGCSYGNEKLRTDISWPYGRVAVVYRESMAKPVIADYREVTNGMRCRV
ncbi:serine/threonine-protein kinase [Streptomyces sp. NPDC058067]|uniref:serine/threonine-protein kinase n=1 Tax=Streptomyces sp. NPDC058067 TaxID=3346324 RepID=UPI0036EC89E1